MLHSPGGSASSKTRIKRENVFFSFSFPSKQTKVKFLHSLEVNMQVAPPPPLGAMCMPLSRFLNKAGFIFEHLEHIKIISLKPASQEFEPIELTVNSEY